MARYIDADALSIYFDALIKHAEMERLYNMAHVYERCLHIVKDAPTADVAPRAEWISVGERLPESDTRCIVWSFDYIWRIRFASYNRGTERWYVVCGGQIKDTKRDGVKVTHWMPLPKPPKAKQPKDSENYEKKRLLAGDCFHGEIWCRCPYCFTGIEVHSIPKDRICHNCGKEYL
jgi:hypothetical protein